MTPPSPFERPAAEREFTVHVPAMTVYAAARLADEDGRLDDLDRLLDTLRAAQPFIPRASEWLGEAQLRATEGIIPFERSPLDIHLTAACLPRIRGEAFKLYSDLAVGRFGGFFIEAKRIAYVDRTDSRLPGFDAAPELLARTRVAAMLEALRLLDGRPLEARPPERGDALLQLDCPACLPLPPDGAAIEAILSLLNAPAENGARPGRPRKIASARLMRTGTDHAELSVRPEQTMETHAASLTGQWLLIDAPVGRWIGPLPDFLGEAGPVPMALDPAQLLAEGIGAYSTASCALPIDDAKALAARHRWFAAVIATDWQGLVSSPHSDETTPDR